eukprot:maker-scaffold_65-snap-gene-0.60-mRNA-1 protein AED:0.02 eAED:0.02 QI:176/0.66/0.5/1/1/1/4/0/436
MQNIKTLFQDDLRAKLEDDKITIKQWINIFNSKPVEISVSVDKIKKVSAIDQMWPDVQPAKRTNEDLVLLTKQLKLRFPNAIVSPLPSDITNGFNVAKYLQKIVSNPFFRTDVAYIDFMDGKLPEYRMTKKKDRRLSEGVIRWLQCTTDFPLVNCDDNFLNTLSAEFDMLEKHQKANLKALQIHYEQMLKLETSANSVASTFEALLAMEKASEKKLPVNLSGLPAERLADYIQGTINMSYRHEQVIKKAYGSTTFKRLFIDDVVFQISLIQTFKSQIREVRDAMRAYKRAQDADANSAGLTEMQIKKNRELLDKRYIDFTKIRQGIVGYELEIFKEQRTEFMRAFYENLARFHMLGSSQIQKEWANSGVEYYSNAQAEEQFFKTNLDYHNQGIRGRTGSLSKSNKNSSQILSNGKGASETVSLQVTTSYIPKKENI